MKNSTLPIQPEGESIVNKIIDEMSTVSIIDKYLKFCQIILAADIFIIQQVSVDKVTTKLATKTKSVDYNSKIPTKFSIDFLSLITELPIEK